jgi:hypothetical protein
LALQYQGQYSTQGAYYCCLEESNCQIETQYQAGLDSFDFPNNRTRFDDPINGDIGLFPFVVHICCASVLSYYFGMCFILSQSPSITPFTKRCWSTRTIIAKNIVLSKTTSTRTKYARLFHLPRSALDHRSICQIDGNATDMGPKIVDNKTLEDWSAFFGLPFFSPACVLTFSIFVRQFKEVILGSIVMEIDDMFVDNTKVCSCFCCFLPILSLPVLCCESTTCLWTTPRFVPVFVASSFLSLPVLRS